MGILLAISSGVASGIFIRSLLVSGWLWGIAFAVASVAALIVYRQARLPAARVLMLFLACATLGYMRFAVADTPLPKPLVAQVSTRVTYRGVIVGPPDLRDSSARTPVTVRAGGRMITMLAVTPRSEAVSVGTRVSVSGTLHVPGAFSSDGGRIFRYDRYLQKDGVRFILDYARVKPIAPAPWYSIPAFLDRVRQAYARGIERALPEPYASLAHGLTLGGKSGLGTELKNAFARTGIVQIIVLSGYHVMLVATAVLALLGNAHARRTRNAVIAGCTLTVFVLLAGAGSAAVRALIMAIFALFARATARSYAAGRILITAVALMLLWNPFLLVFDPGFSLSVAATGGLIWLAPRFSRAFRFIPTEYLRDAFSVTLAAQLAVLPLLLYFMGTLSFVAIPANLLIMPVLPFAMATSALAGIAGMLFGLGHVASLVAFPAYASTGFIVRVARESASLRWAALSVPAFPFAFVIAAYALLIYIYFAASAKRFSTTLQLRLSKNTST